RHVRYLFYGAASLISSMRKEPWPLVRAKLSPQIAAVVKPSLGAPAGCQSARRVKADQGSVECLPPSPLSVKRYSKRSEVSVVLPAARLSNISTRNTLPVLLP